MAKYGFTYTAAKGWPDKFKGTKLTGDRFTTVAETVKAGLAKDEETVVRGFNAMLNIKQGHAAKDAVLEKDKEGKAVGLDLTPAEIQEVFSAATYAEGFSTKARTGGVTAKTRTKIGTRLAESAQTAKALSPQERARKIAAYREIGVTDEELRELGLLEAAPGAEAAPAKNGGATRRPAAATK